MHADWRPQHSEKEHMHPELAVGFAVAAVALNIYRLSFACAIQPHGFAYEHWLRAVSWRDNRGCALTAYNMVLDCGSPTGSHWEAASTQQAQPEASKLLDRSQGP